MLLELSVGDSYGCGFEYASLDHYKNNDLNRYYQHPRFNIKAGNYTDDTQMSLAIAEAMIEGNWNKSFLAGKFLEVFKRDPRVGYARGFYKFLLETETKEDFIKNIKPDSDKSGGAMRASPIGYYRNLGEVLEKSEIQASITHNTKDGINAAKVSSLMTHYFLYDYGKKADLGKFIESQVEGQWSVPWFGEVGEKGWMSVRAAITAIINSNKMSELLKNCINFTGDVDTVAAIAGAAGSCSKEIEKDIPQVLIDSLENGSYGRDYLIELDKKLVEKFK